MHSDYVEQRNGGYYVSGARISLESVVCSFTRGESPEAIQENFPILKLSQIYGAIAFYLDRKAEIDKYVADNERECGGPLKGWVGISIWSPRSLTANR